ncbi:ATP-binding protein [bacterium]|jgi:hypothetical protein|nr:ATP-binding protein [bacterium]
MNENHSQHEFIYKNRVITPSLKEAAKAHPVIIITGARQVGKSTLLRHAHPFNNWKYISLDDFEILEQAENDPDSLWVGAKRIVLDEVQKSPKVLSAIKKVVDSKDRNISFVLSGSANLMLMQKVSESLAGRAVYFNLLPMSYSEMAGTSPGNLLSGLLNSDFPEESKISVSTEDTFRLMHRGFMPPLITFKSSSEYLRWWEGYVSTYLERDLRQLSQIESLVDFRRVMESAALRSGQIMNQTDISRDIKVSQPTVYRYLNILETSCLITRINVYAKNRNKRLVKTPKIYWLDPALAVYLSGYYDMEAMEKSREMGAFFETLVLLHLKIACQDLIPRANVFYWRTVSGSEVDFVVEHGRKSIVFEVKCTDKAKYSDTKSILEFMREHTETTAGVLVYAGNEVKMLSKKVIAVPWQFLS